MGGYKIEFEDTKCNAVIKIEYEDTNLIWGYKIMREYKIECEDTK